MRLICSCLVALGLAISAAAQVEPARYDALRWRCIGPFRGGRTVGIDGVASQPNVLYIGVNHGGVWRTTDYGHTWSPIFDDQPTGSIGCLGVAQSNPNVLYVGSGEGLQRPDLSVGDGMYRSADGGKTWTNTGLKDAQQISGMAVDPTDENRVFAAVLGHPYGPNTERGIFRTRNGGKTWERVLYIDENTGATAVAIDPRHRNTVYAALWSARQAPWENGAWRGKSSGLFKSTDGGTTWRPLTKGLPTPAEGRGRTGITVCAKDPNRLYAMVDASEKGGVYRSDDAGESWRQTSNERRLWGRGDDFAEIRVDPQQPDTVYVANTSFYKSSDGGKTFECTKGAPGGDDFHTIWIHPRDSKLIALAADQGATISVNGGDTWSSWYNQPTAQFYHVSTDNQFPYWVYGGQQESGSAAVASRGPAGAITFREWQPVGAEEYDYVAADPLDARWVYGGRGSKFDRKTGKTINVRPKVEGLRNLRTVPLIFSAADPHALFVGYERVLKTTDGGAKWDVISPDLSRPEWDVPAPFAAVSEDGKTMKRRGVVYALGPSPIDVNVLWAGTDDGFVWVTQDGGAHWQNVTPPDVTSWSKVAQIDASHFEKGTAYIAINRLRCDDLRPYVYRTSNFGRTWTKIVGGLPENAPANTVREDPIKPGLLYCGTERAVHFSADDGAHWNPLRLNMPSTSIRDLVVKDDDLVIGTHGRSFWILDSITALRQIGAVLYAPTLATLVEWNLNSDTPLPPEEPAGQNPPDGVPIDYYLPSTAALVTLELVGTDGKIVRTFRSDDKPVVLDPKSLVVDPRWARPPLVLSAAAGSHRFVWDLRFAGEHVGLSMAAIYRDTPTSRGAFVPPGAYKVRLTVDGKSHEQPLTIRPDPRG